MIDKITVGNSTHDISLPLTACSIGNGDALLITDNSNNGKISKTSLVFDNSTANEALTKKGTFEEFVTPSDFLPIKEHCTYHEYVEIGGIKWATKNVGANSITDYGLYFQWGDTQGYTASQVGSGAGQKYFGWADYKYGNGTSSPGATGMTKYNSTDGKTVLEASDDAVTAAWGGNWRMPTTAEYVALGDAVNSAWTADYQGSGVSGLVLTDKTDSSKVLFFPAAGSCDNGSVIRVGSDGYYWSSSVYSSNVQRACRLSFFSSRVNWQSGYYRYNGFAVRGVLVDPKADKVSGATNGDIATLNASGNLVDSGKSFPASGDASGASQVVLGNDSRLTNARTPSSHTHGNILNGGTLLTNDITIENGDKLVVTDSSNSSKIARTSVSFDGSTTSKALTQKGTFETFATTNSTYKLTVNGTDNGGGSTSLGSIYAPTTAGTSGQVLQSNGSGAPTWTTLNIPSGQMTFKGALGTNGTITSIPTTGVETGDTYKVITTQLYTIPTLKIADGTVVQFKYEYLYSGDLIVFDMSDPTYPNTIVIPSGNSYSLSVGSGNDSNKIILSSLRDGETPYKITVPYANSAGNAATVNGKTVNKNVPSDAVFTDTHHDGSVTADSGYALTKVQVASDGTWSKEQVAIPASLPARNLIANYTVINANLSNVTTSLTEDGSETKVYYNSGSSAVTVSFATSGLTIMDGNDSMEIPVGGVGEVNFLRITTSSTIRIFVRSIVSDDTVTVNTVS